MKTNKTNIFKIAAFVLIVVTGLFSCDKQTFAEPEMEVSEGEKSIVDGVQPENEEDFFYYFDEEIGFRQTNLHQIILKTVPNIHWTFMVSVALWTEKTPYIHYFYSQR